MSCHNNKFVLTLQMFVGGIFYLKCHLKRLAMAVYILTGQKYLDNNNLYSYIQASSSIIIFEDVSTWMLT